MSLARYVNIAISSILLLSSGCVPAPNASPQDPYEPYNRAVFKLNHAVDKAVLRPTAEIYHAIIPNTVQAGIGNVLRNAGTAITLPNDLLQGKIKWACHDFFRFFINTTIGVLGIFDVAQKIGLKRHSNDFGKTLAYYSATTESPYFMLPLLGPSTLRDSFARPFDIFIDASQHINQTTTITIDATRVVAGRSRLLPADRAIDQAFDPYIFVRNASLQRRQQAIIRNNTE